MQADAALVLSSRVANLLRLILVNLLENAVQATPAGKRVTLTLGVDADRLCCDVQEEGSGFPAALRLHLFLPRKSTREGGSGIGLALSKQLADHLGATLDLVEPSTGGCLFKLCVPLSALNNRMAATDDRVPAHGPA